MNTPVCDFVKRYGQESPVRMHMPGHKGASFLGWEGLDITEIEGADWLYGPEGIIRESEENAAWLFGAGQTLYSTEGSSQCIRAMAYLALLAFWEKSPGARPAIIAGRNAHKSFLTACALLDFDIVWLFPENQDYSLCRCDISPARLEKALEETPNAAAVYLTSPDYLGNCADIPALSQVSRKKGVTLLVDNAHGAYRRFLSPSRHPMDEGADICCDSAHKTLPVLTGGAYLHIAPAAPQAFFKRAREAMGLFGSTSPSYLILQSLDRANLYLAEGYREKLLETAGRVQKLRQRLSRRGWRFGGDEPVKLTLKAKEYGYTGQEVGAHLAGKGIVWEYADPDYLVLMPSPENPPEDFARLYEALSALEKKPPRGRALPCLERPWQAMSLRQAMLSPWEEVPLEAALGRTAASPAASCPPAISPAVPGEVITEAVAAVYQYYGIGSVRVVAG